MEVTTEKEIERINILEGKKEFSVKGIKGLKLFCYATGGKIFKFKYQLEGGSYTTKTLGEWVKAVYGIKQAGDDAIEILRKIKSGEDVSGNNSLVKNFGELWAIYKEDALKTQRFKTLKSELSRFEFNLLDIVKNIDIETIKKPSKATPLFLSGLRDLFKTKTILKAILLKKC